MELELTFLIFGRNRKKCVMKRLHIVSNRLPFSISFENDNPSLEPSVGGWQQG